MRRCWPRRSAGDLPTIVAEPGGYASVLEGARKIMERADGILNQVQKVVETNTGPINQSIANVQKFTDALAKNSDGIDDFLAATGEMAKAVSAVAGPLQELTLEARQIVKAVDPGRRSPISSAVRRNSRSNSVPWDRSSAWFWIRPAM